MVTQGGCIRVEGDFDPKSWTLPQDEPEVVFHRWLKALCRFGKIDNHIIVRVDGGVSNLEHIVTTYRARFYTDRNEYSIRCCPPSVNKPKGYLGCIARTRKPRAGETWNRGSDLADGDFSLDTWTRILNDIISYELVKIHKTESKPIPDKPQAGTVGGHYGGQEEDQNEV